MARLGAGWFKVYTSGLVEQSTVITPAFAYICMTLVDNYNVTSWNLVSFGVLQREKNRKELLHFLNSTL